MLSHKRSRRFSCLGIVCGGFFVFALAFAVFGWGLHAKLSLYHIPAQMHGTSVAKLLSERERPMDQAQAFSANDFDIDSVQHSVVALSLEAVQTTPEKYWTDEPRPPSRPIAFRGPTLRRPPPANNA
jgi:hypothetical protein